MTQTRLYIIVGAIILGVVMFGAISKLTQSLTSDVTTVIQNH